MRDNGDGGLSLLVVVTLWATVVVVCIIKDFLTRKGE